MTDENKKTDLDDCVPAMALNEMTSQFDAMFSTLGMAQNKATKFEAAARESAKLANDLQARLDRALQVEEELRLDLLRRESQLEKLEAGKPVSVDVTPTVSTPVGPVTVHTQVDIDRLVELKALCENQKFTLVEVRHTLDLAGAFDFKQLPEIARTTMEHIRLLENELKFKTSLLADIRDVHSSQGQNGGHLATLASELYSALHTARAERAEFLKSTGELEQEVANLRKDVEVITNSRDRLQAVVDRETGQVGALNERITSLTQANSRLTVKVHYLTSALNIVQGERVHELEGQVSELKVERDEALAKLKSVTEELSSIGLSLFPLQFGVDGVFLGDAKQIIDKCNALHSELSTMGIEFGRYKEAHWKLHKSYMELSGTADALTKRDLKQGQELEAARARVADLVGDLDAMSDLAKQAETENVSLRARLADTESLRSQAAEVLSAPTAKLVTSLKTELDYTSERAERLVAENATLRIQLSTAQSSEEKAIAGEAAADARAVRAESAYEKLLNKLRGYFSPDWGAEDLLGAVRDIRNQCLEAEKSVRGYRERAEKAEATIRMTNVDLMRSDNDYMRAEIEAANQALLAAGCGSVKSIAERVGLLVDERAGLRADVTALKTQYTAAEARLEATRQASGCAAKSADLPKLVADIVANRKAVCEHSIALEAKLEEAQRKEYLVERLVAKGIGFWVDPPALATPRTHEADVGTCSMGICGVSGSEVRVQPAEVPATLARLAGLEGE